MDLSDGYKNIYFIGIGGVSMSSLALFLKARGYSVFGSDIVSSSYTDVLVANGIKVNIGHSVENISSIYCPIVVYNSAIEEDNDELCFARKNGLLVLKRIELLNILAKDYKCVIAIAGSHGKTTATAMTAYAMLYSNKRISVHLGGADKNFGNALISGKDYFITELCEYKKNILLFDADIGVLLNADPDHLECYEGARDLYASYEKYLCSASVSIKNLEDEAVPCCTDISYAIHNENATYYVRHITSNKGKYSFDVYEFGKKLDRVELGVFGYYNIYNALAAISVARYCGCPFSCIKKGLKEFRGIKRRFELIKVVGGVRYVADYAHHPNEISSVCALASETAEGGKIHIVFQPHTYSRTTALMDSFISVLSNMENLYLYKTFAAREKFNADGSSFALSSRLPMSQYYDDFNDMFSEISNKTNAGDLVLLLGAGDIYDLAVKKLNEIDN